MVTAVKNPWREPRRLRTVAGHVGREVACQHRRGRNKVGDIARSLTDQSSLIAREEEQLVLLDGTTDDGTELVAFQLVTPCRKKVTTVKNGVAKEFKSIAVKGVGSSLSHRIDGGAGVAAARSILRTRNQPELL